MHWNIDLLRHWHIQFANMSNKHCWATWHPSSPGQAQWKETASPGIHQPPMSSSSLNWAQSHCCPSFVLIVSTINRVFLQFGKTKQEQICVGMNKSKDLHLQLVRRRDVAMCSDNRCTAYPNPQRHCKQYEPHGSTRMATRTHESALIYYCY